MLFRSDVAVRHAHRLADLDVAGRLVLIEQSGLEERGGDRRGTAVMPLGHLHRARLDDQVVDAEPGDRREDMLHRMDLHAVLLQDRAASGTRIEVRVLGTDPHLGSVRQIGAHETHAMIDRRGQLVYVGKAKVLRARLLSYFRAKSRDPKAGRIIGRAETVAPPGKPLVAERWAGCVDAVGGTTLAGVLPAMKYGASVAACGNAGGNDVPASVTISQLCATFCIQVPMLDSDRNAVPMQPYYTIMKLPGGKQAEFVQILPFTPRSKDNLSATWERNGGARHRYS